VLSGHDVLLSSGDAVDAIAASAAIPAIFPPVNIDGRYLMDGGVVNNTPLSHAVALGADPVWVLPTGYSCALPEPPMGALAMAVHALIFTINQRLAVDVARFEQALMLACGRGAGVSVPRVGEAGAANAAAYDAQAGAAAHFKVTSPAHRK